MIVTINGKVIDDPWDAVRTIASRLPNDQLGSEKWLTLLRQIKRDRTEAMPDVRSDVGSQAVLVKEPPV